MFWFGNGNKTKDENSIEINTTPYSPDNEAHVQYILKAVKKYKREKEEFDKLTAAGVGLSGTIEALLFTGMIGIIPAIILNGVLVYFSFETFKVHQLYASVQAQLVHLYDLYYWCEKSQGIKVTKDWEKKTNPFLEILEAIYNRIPTESLFLWKDNVNATDIGKKFTEILSRSPHCLQFPGLSDLQKQSTLDWIKNQLDYQPAQYNLQNVKKSEVVTKEHYLALAELALYGYKPPEKTPEHQPVANMRTL